MHAPGGRVLARSTVLTRVGELRVRDYARAPAGVPALPLQRPPKDHPWRKDSVTGIHWRRGGQCSALAAMND